MCGRYYLNPEGFFKAEIETAEKRLHNVSGKDNISRGEIFPSSVVAVLANSRKLTPSTFPMRWGYNLRNSMSPLINARSETVNIKPLFSGSWLCRRCLIPMDHYFEWEKSNGKIVSKYRIRPAEREPFYLAGIYRYEVNDSLPVCVILTCAPSPEIAFIHNRMPVIIPDSEKGTWMNPNSDPNEVMKQRAVRMVYTAEG